MRRLAICFLLTSAQACVGGMGSVEPRAVDTEDAGTVFDALTSASDAATRDVVREPGPDSGNDIVVLADVATVGDAASDAGVDAGSEPPSVLVFTRTTGFRHGSIANGVSMFQEVAARDGWSLAATEDPGRFTAAVLASVDVVVFLNTSGDVLNNAQQDALRTWVLAGGGWVGVHAASDTEYDWPWYGELVGAWFERHPPTQSATLRIEDPTHPAVRHLGDTWVRRDEWYDYRMNPRSGVRVLMTVDESTYSGGADGSDHPVTWTKELGLSRSFFTGLGHTPESYTEPDFRALLTEAVLWAAR